jgi:hypothetical protein
MGLKDRALEAAKAKEEADEAKAQRNWDEGCERAKVALTSALTVLNEGELDQPLEVEYSERTDKDFPTASCTYDGIRFIVLADKAVLSRSPQYADQFKLHVLRQCECGNEVPSEEPVKTVEEVGLLLKKKPLDVCPKCNPYGGHN